MATPAVRLVTTDHPYHLRRVVAMAADGSNCIVLAHRGCSVLADPVELAHRRARNQRADA